MKRLQQQVEKEFIRQGYPLSEHDLSGCILFETDIMEMVVAGHNIKTVVTAAIENLGWKE